MNWARHFTTVFILGTLTAIACGDGDESDLNGTTGGESSGGTAADAGQAGNGNGDAGTTGEGGTNASAGQPNGGNGTGTEGGAAGAGGDLSPPDPECTGFGLLCEADGDCCSDVCDPATNTCASAIAECKNAGDACEGGTDCCTFHCVNSLCSDEACISDFEACSDDVECCGGKCVDGSCAALNPSCSTAGNDCTDSSQCCSQLCDENGKCSLGASFCIQPGDACVRNPDCCSGECNIADGDLVGTCAIPPSGSTFCSGVDGVLCNDCGDCCSRLCAPYGETGVKICQPVSGCHSTGDLCRTDEDCCGGRIDETLPGYGNGECQIEPGRAIGICRNPVNGEENPLGACSPQGNVCHFKDYECSISSARANCCGGLGAKGGVCQLDTLGVPRCNGLGEDCRDPGETCASADDCCNELPCVPDEDGVLRCGENECQPTGDSCTIDGDCCPGGTCTRAPGEVMGTCDGPPSGEGGAPGQECATYGQLCEGNSDCCNEVPCTNGTCKYPPQ
jgi:hypothetical protein